MPVAARVISNPFEYVPHASYTAGKPGSIVLQSVNIASMVGCIHQIALLADYATEIFDNLQNSTSTIHDRICDITHRTGVLNNQIPEIYRAVLERNVSTLVSGTKKSEVSPATQMLTPLTRPRQISLCYETMNKIPKVDQMDQYLTIEELETKGKCANLYSNPLFFFNEWVRVENARQQLIQEEKEKKKREKQERKALLKKEREKRRSTIKPEKKKGLNWRDRYLNANVNVSQGNESTKKSPVVVQIEPEEEFRPSRRTMLNEIWEKVGDDDEDDKHDENEATEVPQKPSGPAFAPPPPPPSFTPNVPPPSMPPSLPPSLPPSMPPSMPPSLPPSAPPTLPPLPPPPGPPPSAPPPLAPPPPMPPAGPPPSVPPPVPPPPPSHMPNLPSSAPPTPNSSEAYLTATTSSVEIDDLPPPPPRRPNPFGAENDRGNLLTSITQGKKLRSVAQDVQEKPTHKKPSLLDEISKGKNLKKVNLAEAALKKQESKPVEKGLLGMFPFSFTPYVLTYSSFSL